MLAVGGGRVEDLSTLHLQAVRVFLPLAVHERAHGSVGGMSGCSVGMPFSAGACVCAHARVCVCARTHARTCACGRDTDTQRERAREVAGGHWVLEGDRGVTYSEAIPDNTRVVGDVFSVEGVLKTVAVWPDVALKPYKPPFGQRVRWRGRTHDNAG